jgi:hypothetical protein
MKPYRKGKTQNNQLFAWLGTSPSCGAFLSKTTASTGQASVQTPQAQQSGRKKFLSKSFRPFIACVGHTSTHFPQSMHKDSETRTR